MSTSTAPPLSPSRFSVLHSFPLPGDITCTKYRSSATGLHVVLARIPGPIVNGYFVLPTESLSDDGCPHTLEHLVFMGSELYPWKGVLDLLANRHLSQGTNAWTDTDHTAYTLETAGSEGFLALLPVYLDHILYPTLTKSGFVTEVHHVTGEGKNAGVVYCEMQARENTGESLVHRALLEGLYPGVCGYKSETGGIMKDLRTLTIETIRDYHKSYYRPDNLTVIITGDVTLEQVAKSLESFEQRILSKGSLSPMTRPFSSPVPPLTTSVDKTITFASDDEDVGMVHLGFRGPLWSDFESRTALDIMWRYLTQSSVSPLQQSFCETEEPLCGEIDASMIDNSVTIHMVTFDNAETETLSEIKPLFYKVVGEIADKGVDMERMHTVIKKEIRSQLNSFEANPHRKVCSYAIEQALYGLDHPHQRPEQSQFAQLVDVRSRLEHLLEQPSSYWSGLLHRYILDTPYVCIVGVPSKAESERLRITEDERESEQKKKLGPEGLKQAQHALDEANRFNSMPLPPTFLSSFPEPSISRVPEIPVYTIRSKGFTFHDVNTRNESAYLAAHPSASKITEHVAKQSIKIEDVPVLIQFDHIPSQFVQVQALLDTSRLPNELFSWIPLFREIMFESNIIQPNGEVIKALQVIHMLEDETVSYGSKYGLSGSRFSCGVFSQFLFVALKLEAESYAKAIRWLSNILWHTQFTADRIKVAVKRMLADIPQLKNEGRYMTKVGLSHVKFAPRSNHHAINFIRQQTFLKSIEKQLNDTTHVTRIVDTLEKLRSIITEPKYVRMHVAMDVLKQQQLFKTWKDELRHPSLLPPPADGKEEKKATSAHAHEHDHAHGLLYASRDVNRAVNGTDYIVSIPASESSFLLACTDVQVPSFEHGQVASIKVALEYLCACEGPLWKRIRGLGYAYSYSMQLNVEEGLLYFMLYRSTNVSAAWDQAYQIVKDFVQKPESIDLVSLTSSKSSLVFEVLSSADTIGAAAQESLYHVLRKADVGYTSRLLSMVAGVSLGDVHDVLSKHVLALFDQKQSTSVIACNPSSLSTIITELGKAPFSRQLVTINSLIEWFGEKKNIDATIEEKKGMGCDWCKAVKSGGKHTHGTAQDDDPDILPAQRFRWLYINPVFVKRALNLSLLGVGVHLAYQIINTIRSRK